MTVKDTLSYWLAMPITAELSAEFKLSETYVAKSLATLSGDYPGMTNDQIVETFRNDEATLAKQEAEAKKHMKYIAVRTKRPEHIPAYLYSYAKIVGREHEDLGTKVLVVEVDGLWSSAEYMADRLCSMGNTGATPFETLDELKAWGAENGVPNIAEGIEAE